MAKKLQSRKNNHGLIIWVLSIDLKSLKWCGKVMWKNFLSHKTIKLYSKDKILHPLPPEH